MIHAFRLVVVRHGRTGWNADGRFQGQTDVPLDDVGRAQARAVAAGLANETFDFAVASDLSRAWETARLALGKRHVPLAADPRWREMRFGTWEGLTWPQIVERDPQLASVPPAAPKSYTPQGGETFDELCIRIAEAVAAIDARASDGASIMVATHAGPLHALLRVALGESEATALGVRFSPGSVTRIGFERGAARLIDLNATFPHEAAS